MFRDVMYYAGVVILFLLTVFLTAIIAPLVAPGATIFIGFGIMVFLYSAAFMLNRMRIRISDRWILETTERIERDSAGTDPETALAFKEYFQTHPVRQLPRTGVKSAIRRFYTFTPLNFRAAGFLTLLAAGYYCFMSLANDMPHDMHWTIFLVLSAVKSVAVVYPPAFLLTLVVTTVPYKSWVRRHRKGNDPKFSELDRLFGGARYIASGNSLIALGEEHLLLCNLNGLMVLPLERVRSVRRCVWNYPHYLELGHGTPLKISTGLCHVTGLYIEITLKARDCYDAIPHNWCSPHIVESAIGWETADIPFLLNEYQMTFLYREIRRLIAQNEPYPHVSVFGEAPNGPFFGNYNLSDYL